MLIPFWGSQELHLGKAPLFISFFSRWPLQRMAHRHWVAFSITAPSALTHILLLLCDCPSSPAAVLPAVSRVEQRPPAAAEQIYTFRSGNHGE